MTKARGMRRKGSQGGFTLFEAFVVLAIVAILATISVPAIVNTLAHQKLAQATDSFVNQVDYARVQAAAKNRAYQLRVVLSDGNNCGAVYLDEGASSACTRENFDPTVNPAAKPGRRAVLYDTEYPTVRIESISPPDLVGTAQVPAGGDPAAGICFKPDGRVVRVDTGEPITPGEGYAAGEVIFVLRLYEGKDSMQPTGRKKTVVIPYNGIPKVQ